MSNEFKLRTSFILGDENIDLLNEKKVIIFGVGGVGSFAAEALARVGIGNLTLVDFDEVDITNVNRQIPALHSTVGMNKVDVMKDRILDINPDINIRIFKEKYFYENSEMFFDVKYDYVVDAIDMVTSKLGLIRYCYENDMKIISSMGMGNKIDPTKIEVTEIEKTHTDPLAKIMRKELKERNLKKVKVVYSTEQPVELKKRIVNGRKLTPGSISFVPSVGGLTIASVVVRDLLDL
ncbi:MAG: tRNA threonylcarbamoyladenosine dehydratase [Clostridioides sp.]|jgi:tRNA A37 threonylcarbamoyladenosine dehydratase|nr:tRNA threonylcarbamoyladenosine dehydratase [Clostridioides sp.]